MTLGRRSQAFEDSHRASTRTNRDRAICLWTSGDRGCDRITENMSESQSQELSPIVQEY
jgi:hypothetical protein